MSLWYRLSKCHKFVQYKSEFVQYKNLVENQLSQKIKIDRTDNRTECINKQFDEFLANSGIKRQTTHEQLGVTERMDREAKSVTLKKIRLTKRKKKETSWTRSQSNAFYCITAVNAQNSC